jgi:hypothetical protein
MSQAFTFQPLQSTLDAFKDDIKSMPETLETVDAAGNKTVLVRGDSENRLRQRMKDLEHSDVDIVEEITDEDYGTVPVSLAHTVVPNKGIIVDHPYENTDKLVKNAEFDTSEVTAEQIEALPAEVQSEFPIAKPAANVPTSNDGTKLVVGTKFVPKGGVNNKLEQVAQGATPSLPKFVNAVGKTEEKQSDKTDKKTTEEPPAPTSTSTRTNSKPGDTESVYSSLANPIMKKRKTTTKSQCYPEDEVDEQEEESSHSLEEDNSIVLQFEGLNIGIRGRHRITVIESL